MSRARTDEHHGRADQASRTRIRDGSLTLISALPLYAVIVPETQIVLPSGLSGTQSNLSPYSPHIVAVKSRVGCGGPQSMNVGLRSLWSDYLAPVTLPHAVAALCLPGHEKFSGIKLNKAFPETDLTLHLFEAECQVGLHADIIM